MDSSKPPAFEFITLTQRPASHKHDFSHTVRSHAMQSFLHQKRTAKSKNVASNGAASSSAESKTPGQLSGKFKLTTWSRKPRRKMGKKGVVETMANAEYGFDSTEHRDVEQIKPISTIQAYENSLPISAQSISTKQLLYHYNTEFNVNAFAINFDDAWKPFSITDSALLHATLCLVAQHQDLVRGTQDSSDNLWHKGEVMRLMNIRLRQPDRVVTDADITSVALLLILESINGTYEAASAHRVGLLNMIDGHGGYWSFQETPVVQRVIAWADIVHSTRFYTPPSFPAIFPSSNPFDGPLLHTIPSQPQCLLPTTIFPSIASQALLQTLRNITYAIDDPSMSLEDKKAICDALNSTELWILASEHYVPSFYLDVGADIDAEYDIAEGETGEGNRTHDGGPSSPSALTRAFTLSALFYLHLTIRELPSSSLLHTRLLTTLLSLLHSSRTSPSFPTSSSSVELDILLWCVFVGCAVAKDSITRIELIMVMFNAQPEIEWVSLEDVKGRLRGVVWRKGVCDEVSGIIWDRIRRRGFNAVDS